MKSKRFKSVLKWLNRYLTFFLLIGFVISCCTMLFVTLLAESLGVTLTSETIGVAAKLTFGNVLLLTLAVTVIDAVRRKYTVELPVRRITEAAEKLMQGDFSVRISEKKQFASDDTFRKIIRCFNKLAEELGSVETLRTDFIANVSHEMKTPLAVMQNYGKLLQQPDLSSEERMEYAKGVSDGAKRLADMMTNILKLNRLENQQIYPRMEAFDLTEQLCESLLQYESVWEDKGIAVETDLAENITVKADAELLSLVWNNLLSNAFKFTPEAGTVSVSLTATERHAVVTVRDTGIGMTPEVGEHMFEKFYQGDTSHSTQGNGLGLALVKRVIDILQGEISVESAVGKGTAFTVRIRR